MEIEVNGARRTVVGATVAEALGELGFVGAHLATALNGDFVPAAARAARALRAGDRLEVLSPMQGG